MSNESAPDWDALFRRMQSINPAGAHSLTGHLFGILETTGGPEQREIFERVSQAVEHVARAHGVKEAAQ